MADENRFGATQNYDHDSDGSSVDAAPAHGDAPQGHRRRCETGTSRRAHPGRGHARYENPSPETPVAGAGAAPREPGPWRASPADGCNPPPGGATRGSAREPTDRCRASRRHFPSLPSSAASGPQGHRKADSRHTSILASVRSFLNRCPFSLGVGRRRWSSARISSATSSRRVTVRFCICMMWTP